MEEEHHPGADFGQGGAKAPELPGEIPVPHDGSHIDLAEEAAEEAVFVGIGGKVRLAVIEVHQVPQAGEGVDHHPDGHLGAHELARRGEGHEEEDILGGGEENEAEGPPVPLPPEEKGLRKEVVRPHRGQHDEEPQG